MVRRLRKSQLELRLQIKNDLGYGFMAVVYAYAMYISDDIA